jgi:hypothetical protein
MMELIERAIPVIQHPPEARTPADLAPREPVAATAEPVLLPESPAASPVTRCTRGDEERDLEATLSGVRAALERLRVQHAQLTSGAVLQQYQRQLTIEIEDSRPATRVLSVQG